MSTESTENWQIGLEAGWNFYCADDGWVGEHAAYGKTDSAASYDAAEIGALHLQRRGAPRPPTEAEMLKAHREMMESQRDSLAVEIVTALNVADSLPAVQKVVEFYDLRELFEGVPLDKRFTAAESQAIGDAFERRALALGFSRAPAPAEVNSPPEGTLYQVDDGAGGTPQFGGVAVAGHAAPLAQQMLPSKILTHPSTLMRAGGLDAEHVESLRELYAAGASLPAVDVYFDGTSHWLGDGNHRHMAAGEAGALLDVRVHKGTLRDAILHAVRANAEHGLKRTNDDKRLAVVTLLSDPEWFRQSDTALAELARVTQPFVSSVRRDLAMVADALPAAGDVSDEEVAEHFDVSAPLVRIVRDLPDEQRDSLTHNVMSDTGRRRGSDGVVRKTPVRSSPDAAPLFENDETNDASDVTKDGSDETGATVEEPRAPQTPTPAHNIPPVAHSKAADAVQTPAPAAEESPDPEGWSEMELTLNLTVKRGKSLKRDILVSGRAGDGPPVWLTEFTLADLQPLPPALSALVSRLKDQYVSKGAPKVAAARQSKPAKKAAKKPQPKRAAQPKKKAAARR